MKYNEAAFIGQKNSKDASNKAHSIIQDLQC